MTNIPYAFVLIFMLCYNHHELKNNIVTTLKILPVKFRTSAPTLFAAHDCKYFMMKQS